MLHPEEEIGVLRLSKLGPGREGYYLQAVGLEPPGRVDGKGSATVPGLPARSVQRS